MYLKIIKSLHLRHPSTWFIFHANSFTNGFKLRELIKNHYILKKSTSSEKHQTTPKNQIDSVSYFCFNPNLQQNTISNCTSIVLECRGLSGWDKEPRHPGVANGTGRRICAGDKETGGAWDSQQTFLHLQKVWMQCLKLSTCTVLVLLSDHYQFAGFFRQLS